MARFKEFQNQLHKAVQEAKEGQQDEDLSAAMDGLSEMGFGEAVANYHRLDNIAKKAMEIEPKIEEIIQEEIQEDENRLIEAYRKASVARKTATEFWDAGNDPSVASGQMEAESEWREARSALEEAVESWDTTVCALASKLDELLENPVSANEQ